MSDIVLEIKALTRRFGSFTAVDALTLSVNAGEVFGLLGSNGAGKTTTIKMLTTLLPPSSGEARVAGFSITTQAVGVRRAIGYVPQAVSVDGSLTGYENLLIFGQVFSRSGAMHTGKIPYLDFIAPGILAQSVLFVAIFFGINVIWERDLGIVQKFLASPTPRAALVLGKGFSAGARTLSQAAIVYCLSLLLGVKLNWSPLALLNVVIIVVLASTLFSTFSLIIACIVKTRERFMGVGQVLTMPLFFASNAIYPTDIMPNWLKIISHLNPLTYVVDALRTFMLAGSTSTFGLGRDYAVILLTMTLLVLIGARLYPRLAS